MAAGIRAGRLRWRVTFQQNVPTTRDEHGEPEDAWESVATVWADIEPLGGRELWYARQTLETATHRITCRWSSATTALMTSANRATTSDGRVFNGVFVRDVETESRRMEFVCEEAVTGD